MIALEELRIPEEMGRVRLQNWWAETSRHRDLLEERRRHEKHCSSLEYISLWRDAASGLKGKYISLAGI